MLWKRWPCFLKGQRTLCLCTTLTPIQGFRMCVTSNCFCHKPRAFSGCCCAQIHSTTSGLFCQGTPVRLACSYQSTHLDSDSAVQWFCWNWQNKHQICITQHKLCKNSDHSMIQREIAGERREGYLIILMGMMGISAWIEATSSASCFVSNT